MQSTDQILKDFQPVLWVVSVTAKGLKLKGGGLSLALPPLRFERKRLSSSVTYRRSGGAPDLSSKRKGGVTSDYMLCSVS